MDGGPPAVAGVMSVGPLQDLLGGQRPGHLSGGEPSVPLPPAAGEGGGGGGVCGGGAAAGVSICSSGGGGSGFRGTPGCGAGGGAGENRRGGRGWPCERATSPRVRFSPGAGGVAPPLLEGQRPVRS